MTLVFSVSQAILCALAGATYVSPFVGRLDQIGENGIDLIRDISRVYCVEGVKTQILAASIVLLNKQRMLSWLVQIYVLCQ